jgi:hypothetical protein
MDALRNRRRGVVMAFYAVLCCAPLGCMNTTWDEVWSRDFKFKEWWTPPDPLVVLRDSTDGDRRARALRALGEPDQKKGSTPKEQDFVIELLTKAAATERAALCRLAAIESLEKFKDPRVVKALEDAYYRATSFQPDTASIIRCRALEAMGGIAQPAAVDILVRVLREPTVADQGSESEKQQKTDERTAAARALGHYQGRPAAEALLTVMKTEQDVALRDRAYESLQVCTGQNIGPDIKLWEGYLQNAGKDQAVGVVPEKTFGDKVHDLVVPASFR